MNIISALYARAYTLHCIFLTIYSDVSLTNDICSFDHMTIDHGCEIAQDGQVEIKVKVSLILIEILSAAKVRRSMNTNNKQLLILL